MILSLVDRYLYQFSEAWHCHYYHVTLSLLESIHLREKMWLYFCAWLIENNGKQLNHHYYYIHTNVYLIHSYFISKWMCIKNIVRCGIERGPPIKWCTSSILFVSLSLSHTHTHTYIYNCVCVCVCMIFVYWGFQCSFEGIRSHRF